MRICEVCLEDLPLSEYIPYPNADGLYKWCNTCRKAYFREYHKKYRLKHKQPRIFSYKPRGGYHPRKFKEVSVVPEKLPEVPWIPETTIHFQ